MKSLGGQLVATLLLLIGGAHAQTLYKCVAGNGAVSWQSAPCAQGTRMARSVAYTPELPAAVPVSGPVLKSNARNGRRASGRRVSMRASRARPDACARAREHRQATLERVGLKRNFDLLSKLDAAVRRACG